MPAPLRIANCSGFYGDRLSAAREMVTGGPIDFLTGDYLAELTMMILWKAQQKDAVARLRRHVPASRWKTCSARRSTRGVKIVTNAGGLNPAGLTAELRSALRPAGPEGQDSAHRRRRPDAAARRAAAGRPRAATSRHRPAAARAAAPSRSAPMPIWARGASSRRLNQGADIVVCPRVTDASVVVGPAAWHFGWKRDDWDRLAGAVVAGHVVECGTQCTGGNYAFFQEVPGLEHPGFPDRRNARRRFVRHHQARGHRRTGVGRHGHGPVALRNRQAGLRQSRRRGPLRHDPARAGRRPTACASPACAASRRRRRSRSA